MYVSMQSKRHSGIFIHLHQNGGISMYQFYVNNELYQVEGDGKLLPFLRDVCKCKSVKDGCSEGACGTCHVLVDGVAMTGSAGSLTAEPVMCW